MATLDMYFFAVLFAAALRPGLVFVAISTLSPLALALAAQFVDADLAHRLSRGVEASLWWEALGLPFVWRMLVAYRKLRSDDCFSIPFFGAMAAVVWLVFWLLLVKVPNALDVLAPAAAFTMSILLAVILLLKRRLERSPAELARLERRKTSPRHSFYVSLQECLVTGAAWAGAFALGISTLWLPVLACAIPFLPTELKASAMVLLIPGIWWQALCVPLVHTLWKLNKAGSHEALSVLVLALLLACVWAVFWLLLAFAPSRLYSIAPVVAFSVYGLLTVALIFGFEDHARPRASRGGVRK